MGENARIIAQKQYHPDIIVKQTLEMYRSLLN